MRLIDADALESKLGSSDEDIIFSEMIYESPTINPINRGKWGFNNNYKENQRICDFEEWYTCSVCLSNSNDAYMYCPNCGARLEYQ